MKFTRNVLQGIRDGAIKEAKSVPNNHWQRAYKQLADAADRLDAMRARTEEKVTNPSLTKKLYSPVMLCIDVAG